MCRLSNALSARTSWALHRIALVAGDSHAAKENLLDAEFFAQESGRISYCTKQGLPHLLADVPFLACEWDAGWKDARAFDH